MYCHCWVHSQLLNYLKKQGIVGPVNSALCLLHSESMCMTSAVTVHMRWKKKWKRETQNADVNKPNPKGHVVMLIFLMEVVVLVYNQIWSQTFLISQNELLINALRVPINGTLNYQGQGFFKKLVWWETFLIPYILYRMWTWKI